jgi:anti-sigma regulatory factor (Ser/Thr protein kinase)
MPEMMVPLSGAADSPRTARTVVSAFCSDQHVAGSLITDVLLAVSELVTNAVVHGRPPIELRASCADGRLRIGVSDAEAQLASPVALDVLAVGGRGLGIVAALADDTGVDRHPTTKTVWASWRLTWAPQPTSTDTTGTRGGVEGRERVRRSGRGCGASAV